MCFTQIGAICGWLTWPTPDDCLIILRKFEGEYRSTARNRSRHELSQIFRLLSNGLPDKEANREFTHQRWIKACINYDRRSSLITWTRSMWANNQIVVDSNGDRLRGTK